MQQRQVTLTPADILALNATPFEIIPAPGAGRIVVPFLLVCHLQFNTLPYLAGSAVGIWYKAGATIDTTYDVNQALLTAAADSVEENYAEPDTVGVQAIADMENQPVVLKTRGAAYTTGNSPLTITVFYGTAKLP